MPPTLPYWPLEGPFRDKAGVTKTLLFSAWNAMLNEPGTRISLKSADVRQYLAADALFDAVGDRDPMPFWKSAPYLVHFMRGYKLNERLEETLELSPSKVAAVLQSHRQSFLSAEALHQWSELDPAHPKMREMVSDQLDRGIWRLLWASCPTS